MSVAEEGLFAEIMGTASKSGVRQRGMVVAAHKFARRNFSVLIAILGVYMIVLHVALLAMFDVGRKGA